MKNSSSVFACGFFVGLLFMAIPMLEIKSKNKLTNELYEEAKHNSMVYKYNFELCKSMLNRP
jgi:hypothetical protein